MVPYSDMYWIEDLVFTLIPALVSGVPSILFGIATYVLSSMALYTMATRRGLSKAWLSWIPVVNVWILGSLSDQYRYVVKGQYKSKRKILLALRLVAALMAVILIVAVIFLLVDVVNGAMYGVYQDTMTRMVMGPVFGIVGLCVPLIGVSIAAAVIRYMALYDVFHSMDPNNSVMFLVLSILFGITEPFFLFFNRNKDEGMPPRRQAPVQEEPWEENRDYL